MMSEIINQPRNTGIVKVRNSSVEMYRILAVFIVLVAHFNGWFVGGVPSQMDFEDVGIYRVGQLIIAALSCICVNMFIIISGYYGIKFKLSSIFRICLLLMLIYVPSYLLLALINGDFNWIKFIGSFFVISRAGYFVQCYLMLMFLSPILNSFVEKYKERIILYCVIFAIIEFWMGCVMAETVGLVDNLFFNRGYSLIHFCLIYLMARCLYLLHKQNKMLLADKMCIMGYIVCTMIICVMYLFKLNFSLDYANPVVVISSFFTFVPFCKRNFYNKHINWVSKDTLAVYILQVTPPFITFLMWVDETCLNTFCAGLYWVLACVIIILFFCACVLYSKLCNIIIEPIMNFYYAKINIRILD